MLGLKIVLSERNDAWYNDVVSFNATDRWCVDGVVYWFEFGYLNLTTEKDRYFAISYIYRF
jgi:hypothetical protein